VPAQIAAPDETVEEESSAILIQNVPIHAEMVAVDASLGVDGARSDMAVARPGDAVGSDASALVPLWGTCLDLVVRVPGHVLLGDPAPGEVVQAPGSLTDVDSGGH
jgi:hypothetical protein